ncbi:MAG: hypothetical protein Q8K65_03005 [Alphaproteobacteria bacterium]|nr:hypothetical protein [Alphaproteobacteria bacterium]
MQPADTGELTQLHAVVAVVAAQYDLLDETILDVPEADVSATLAALEDALAICNTPAVPFSLSTGHFYNIFKMLGSVGQEYPLLTIDPASGLTHEAVGRLGDRFLAISRQIPHRGGAAA